MLKITRFTDQGVIVLSILSALPPGGHFNTRDLAQAAHLPMCTVGKIVKLLTRARILVSHRGVSGGYGLAKAPCDISLREIVLALDGGADRLGTQAADARPLVADWEAVNTAVRQALGAISLSQMVSPRYSTGGVASTGPTNETEEGVQR